MKKYTVLLLLIFFSSLVSGQELKLSYDMDEKVYHEKNVYDSSRIIPPTYYGYKMKVLDKDGILYKNLKTGESKYITPTYIDYDGRVGNRVSHIFSEVFFYDDNFAYLIGSSGTVYKTTDGGETFNENLVKRGKFSTSSIHYLTDEQADIDFVTDGEFISKDTLIIVGMVSGRNFRGNYSPVIIITTDGFQNAKGYPIPDTCKYQVFVMIEFDDEKKVGYIYAKDNGNIVAVMKSIDRGMNWTYIGR